MLLSFLFLQLILSLQVIKHNPNGIYDDSTVWMALKYGKLQLLLFELEPSRKILIVLSTAILFIIGETLCLRFNGIYFTQQQKIFIYNGFPLLRIMFVVHSIFSIFFFFELETMTFFFYSPLLCLVYFFIYICRMYNTTWINFFFCWGVVHANDGYIYI